jgi:hypothetical protein
MESPTIEAMLLAAKTGVTVILPNGQTARIPGASARVGDAIVDVLYDADYGTFSWMVDGVSRSGEWVQRFFASQP